jgi:hypothetical protein
MVEMVKIQEEVTLVQAAAMMARARVVQAEGMAWERATLLVTSREEAVEATQRASNLGDELATICRAKDTAEERILGLEAEVSMAHHRREAAEEQCE